MRRHFGVIQVSQSFSWVSTFHGVHHRCFSCPADTDLVPDGERILRIWVSLAAGADLLEDLRVLGDSFNLELMLARLAKSIGVFLPDATNFDSFGLGVHVSGHPFLVASMSELDSEMVWRRWVANLSSFGVPCGLSIVNSTSNCDKVTIVLLGQFGGDVFDEEGLCVRRHLVKSVTVDFLSGTFGICHAFGRSLSPVHPRSWSRSLAGTSWCVCEVDGFRALASTEDIDHDCK